MPLGPWNIIQVNSGNNSATETQTVTVSLSSPTGGNTALVGLSMDVAVTAAPSGFVLDIDALAASGVAHNSIYRKQVSAGETSWNFTTNFGGQVAWWVLEVSGLDPAPLIASGHDDNLAGTSAQLFPSSPVTQTDTLVLAAVQGGVSVGSAVTFSGWTNSFVELADQGTTSPGSNQYSVAVAYLFPGLPGGFGTVVTASSSATMSFASASYLGANIELPLVGYTRRVGGQ